MVSLHAFVLAAALAASQDVVLLDFSADWCGPCRSMEPTLERLTQAGYPVRRVNVDKSPELARHFAIGPIPCFVLVSQGHEVQRVVGATSYEQLVQMFQQIGYGPAQADVGSMRGQSPDRLPLPSAQSSPPHNIPVGTSPLASSPSAAQGQQMPPPQASTTSLPDQQLTPAQRMALQATVRLRVSDETGQSKGTGTIIDVHGDEALIVTCGHIFRESQGKGEILVELFAPDSRGPLPGHLLLYECDQRDFGLVSIRLDVPVTPVKVATTTYHPQPGEPIFSVGCNHGADPTVRTSTISAIDRYVGPPNIEIHGHPVEGRSGGGLFTCDGRIIGICNAADLQEDRGIYAALPTIHLALDRIGQRAIYVQQENPPITLASDSRPPRSTRPLGNTGLLAATTRESSAPAPGAAELICVVRAPDGTTQVVLVSHPSAELLQRVAMESRQQALPARPEPPRPDDRSIARLSELPRSSTGPVVRAQGY